MQRHFGARTPMQTFVIKVRWLIGGMITVIVLLVTSLVYVAFSGEAQTTVPSPQLAQAAVPEAELLDVLVPRERIEAGTRLEDVHFTRVATRAQLLLPGTILELSALRDKYAKKLLEPGIAILSQDISSEPPYVELPIPPGYRAVTIAGSAQELVDGFVRPGSRVDVLWRYKDASGVKKIATLVHAVRVLSLAQNTNPQAKLSVGKGTTTVTLIVTENEAKDIELARGEGGLSLSLLGDTSPLPVRRDDPGIVSLPAILKRQGEVEEKTAPAVDGTMIMYDPASGQQRRFVLIAGTWRLASSEG